MSSDYAAAERLARGLPLREALDTSSAEAWTALDVGVRMLAGERPGLLPSHSWVAGAGPYRTGTGTAHGPR